jgi:hypothetical protein
MYRLRGLDDEVGLLVFGINVAAGYLLLRSLRTECPAVLSRLRRWALAGTALIALPFLAGGTWHGLSAQLELIRTGWNTDPEHFWVVTHTLKSALVTLMALPCAALPLLVTLVTILRTPRFYVPVTVAAMEESRFPVSAPPLA